MLSLLDPCENRARWRKYRREKGGAEECRHNTSCPAMFQYGQTNDVDQCGEKIKKKEGEQIPSPSPNPLCEASRGRFSPLEGKHDMASEYGLANNGQNTITLLHLVPLIGNAIETRWAKKRECLTSMFQSFETVSSNLIFPRPAYVKQL